MSRDLKNWQENIPSNWNLTKLKYLAKLRDEKVDQKNKSQYVGLEDIVSQTGKLKDSLTHDNDVETVSNAFYAGDVLFGKLRPYLAKVFRANFNGKCTGELLVLEANEEKLDGSFLKYLMLSESFIDEVNSSSYGSKMPRANWSFIGNINIPVPKKNIQLKIIRFLDKKTTEIDSLIEDKEKLIELLEEKRQAIITEIVTKGLESNTEMKNSGIEWIGEVPEHWSLRKVKYVFKQISEKNHPKERLLSVLKGKGLLPRNELEFKAVMAFKDLENFKLVKQKDFVIHLRSFQSGFEMSNIRGIVSPAYTVFRPHLDVDNAYFKYVFYSKYFIDYIGATTQSLRDGKPIAYDDFSSSKIMLPPKSEQEDISSYLSNLCENIDKAKELTLKQLDKLKEHRQSLIYEAVTGKIDVQEMMNESEQEEVPSS